MAEDTSVATPPVTGAEPQAPMQEPSQEVQTNGETQKTGSNGVDTTSKEPQVTETARPSQQLPQYDGLFRQEKKRIRRLEETINLQNKRMEELISSFKSKDTAASEPEKFDPKAFFDNPEAILTARERKLLNEIGSLRQEVSDWKVNQEAEQKNRKSLEALEKLFPKSSPDSNESLAQRVNRDPERAERIKEFLEETGLDQFSLINPDLAVEIAMHKLGERQQTPNPTVLKKTAMGGVSTGNPGMGSKTRSTLDDYRSELKKLSDEAEKNPNLRFDDKFKTKRAEVIKGLERLMEEKRG